MNIAKVCQHLQALAQQTRLQVLQQLMQAGNAGMSAGDLCKQLNVSCSAMSFHLAQLGHANLVTSKRDGRCIIYAVNRPVINELIHFAKHNFLQ